MCLLLDFPALADDWQTVQKEEFMRGVKDFLRESREAMIDYLLVVSTTSLDEVDVGARSLDGFDGSNIIHSLRERARSKPMLDRESIPSLPYLVDSPRDLAVVTSAVIRHSRDYLSTRDIGDDSSKPINELYKQCSKVEEQALERVTKLASRMRPNRSMSLFIWCWF
jgi:hypothetical protein